MVKVDIQQEDFEVGQEVGGGAVTNFIGIVRGDDGVKALTLEHYPAMTQRSLEDLAQEALTRWSLFGVRVIHRVGRLPLGDQIVFVGTASAHRHASLEACAYIMDRLKTDAPFWKKESRADGTENWVEERQSDQQAVRKW